jgi:TrmH family RNA methyltransferase
VAVSKTELKKIKSLLTKKGRKKHRMFLAEGVRLLEESARFRFWPLTVYYAPALLSERGAALVKRFERHGIETKKLSSRELHSIADTETPQGLVGLFLMPEFDKEQLYRHHYRRLLLCENISDPGNLGTLIRSALAFGFDAVLVCGDTAEPYAPKVVRATAGALFGLPVVTLTHPELKEFLCRREVTVITSVPEGDADNKLLLKNLKSPQVILAVGSEAVGLSQAILKHADLRLRIRHTTGVQSLNAAVAGSILMKEIYDMSTRG